jgi:hypothetical protein
MSTAVVAKDTTPMKVLKVTNLALFLITMSLAAHMIDNVFDRKLSFVLVYSSLPALAFLFISVLASSVGIASNLCPWTLNHNTTTLGLSWLAGGFAIKCLRSTIFDGSRQSSRESKALASLHIILMVTTLLYCVGLHLYYKPNTVKTTRTAAIERA